MKKLLNFILIATMASSMISCGKYEEGPGISLKSKTSRVANIWKVEYAQDLEDQSDVTLDFAGEQYEFTKEGEFLENGKVEGSWEFNSEKTHIVITDLNNEVDQFKIIRLKEESMHLEVTGELLIHFIPV